MERDQVVARLHGVAEEMASSGAFTAAQPADASATDSLLERFGFDSIGALEYLLAIEEEFGITFEDEDLSEEMLTSTDHLADRVLRQLAADSI